MSANYLQCCLPNKSIQYFLLAYGSFPLQKRTEKNDLFPVSEDHCSLTKNVSMTVLLFMDFSHKGRFRQPIYADENQT